MPDKRRTLQTGSVLSDRDEVTSGIGNIRSETVRERATSIDVTPIHRYNIS